jgi:hypothetical protein
MTDTPTPTDAAGPTEDTPFEPEDDAFHEASGDPYWVETTWFSFNVPERRMGGWLHAQSAVHRRVTTWRVFVWDPRGALPGELAYHRRAEEVPFETDLDLRHVRYPGGGFTVDVVRPTMDYRVTYTDGDRCTIDLLHEGVHPPHRFTPGAAPMVHNPHFDQLGHVTGRLVLSGEEIPVDCWSVRDRTWGPRGGPHAQSRKPEHVQGRFTPRVPGGPAWRQVERQRGRGRIQYVFGHVDDRTGFLGFARPQDGDAKGWAPVHVGWLLQGGRFERLDAARSRLRDWRDPATGWTAHLELDLVDRTGRAMAVEGTAMSRIAEQGDTAHSLMRWEMDGQVGWGEDQDVWNPSHFRAMREALQGVISVEA